HDVLRRGGGDGSANLGPPALQHLATKAAGVGAAHRSQRQRCSAYLPGVVAARAAGTAQPSTDTILRPLLFERYRSRLKTVMFAGDVCGIAGPRRRSRSGRAPGGVSSVSP